MYLKHTELHGESPRPKRLSEQRMQGSACRTAVIFGTYDLFLCLKHTELHGETPRPKCLSEQRMQGSACQTVAIFGIYYILMVLFMNLMWHTTKQGVPRPKRLSE